jgi:hypothetical protein
MRSCRRNRWDFSESIKSPERPSNTEASKEIQQRLAALEAERTKQDKIWTQALTPEQEIKNASNLNQSK